MKVENHVTPKPSQVQEFIATEGPVCMVNLLKFCDEAVGRDRRTWRRCV